MKGGKEIILQNLLNYIEQFVPLKDTTIEAILSLAVTKQFARNHFILRQGQRCDFIWYLNSGMVRKFYLSEDKEITSWIHTENQIFTSINSYARQMPSDEFIQASEDVEIIGISRDNSKKLSRYPEILEFTNLMMEEEFINIDIHGKAMSQKDAKGKYEYLCKIAPEVIKRAKLIHIASMLNLSPETLSRIRKSY